MPDHVHLLVNALVGKSPLEVASCFKRLVTIEARKRGYSELLWQRRVHDRGLRTNFNNNLDTAVRYVLDNPVQQGLVPSWEKWPFSYLHSDFQVKL